MGAPRVFHLAVAPDDQVWASGPLMLGSTGFVYGYVDGVRVEAHTIGDHVAIPAVAMRSGGTVMVAF
ncbi:hypothetical protein, partial [Klebsiella quasipneumoniae]|uniref:hypothetical protein n=1 Tax=Klebsiella quasipneumoniae TaxID=1463165 RepID=UPI0020062610